MILGGFGTFFGLCFGRFFKRFYGFLYGLFFGHFIGWFFIGPLFRCFYETFFGCFFDIFLNTFFEAFRCFFDPVWMLWIHWKLKYLWSSFEHAFSEIISIHCKKWTPSFFSQVKGIFLPSFISVSYCQCYLWSCKSSHFYRLLSFDPTKKITCLQLYNYVCIFVLKEIVETHFTNRQEIWLFLLCL